jgi:glycosyltransferase involved in cell wall biosynthesis
VGAPEQADQGERRDGQERPGGSERERGGALVASDVGALPEKIRHGVDGLLFPPGDAAALARILRELYDDPDRLRSLRENVAPTHLMSDHVREVQMIYEEAMDG